MADGSIDPPLPIPLHNQLHDEGLARCAMEGLQVCSSSVQGRFLEVQKPFDAGQVVLRCKPYAAVLYDQHLPKRCAYCFEPGEKLLRCSMSKAVYFCSSEHHRLAWADGYKEEAQALAKSQGRMPPATLRLCARVIWRRAREAANGDTQSYQAVQDLLHHWELLDDSRKAMYAQMAVVCRQYMQGAASSPSAVSLPAVREVALLLARFACNNHTMCDEELRPFGVGLYPLAALANHSCRPTCVQSFAKGGIGFRALQPLQPGDPVTISYIELAATRRERRENLQYLYFFDLNMPAPQPAASAAAGNAAAAAQLQGDAEAAAQPHANGDGAASLPGGAAHASAAEGAGGHVRDAPQAGQVAASVAAMRLEGGAARQGGTNGVEAQAKWQLPDDFQLVWLGTAACPGWACDPQDPQLTQVVSRQSGAALPGGLEVSLHASGSSAGSSQPRPEPEDEDSLLLSLVDTGSTQRAKRLWCWGAWTQELAACSRAAGNTAEEETGDVHHSMLMGSQAGQFCCRMAEVARTVLQAEQLTQQGQLEQAIQLLQGALATVDGSTASTGSSGSGGSSSTGSRGSNSGGSTATSGSSSSPLKLGPSHLLRQRLLAALLKAAIDQGQSWLLALSCARSLAAPFQLVYPPVWPNLGLHWAMLAKLENLVGEERLALQAADGAARVTAVTHPDSPLLLEQLQLRHDLQRSLE